VYEEGGVRDVGVLQRRMRGCVVAGVGCAR
jgi:hypothetical protein